MPFWLRQFLILLTISAFLGGTTAQAVASTGMAPARTTTTAPPCANMPMMATDAAAGKAMPCDGMTPGCMKRLCCVSLSALPERAANDQAPIPYAKVSYASPSSAWDSLSSTPPVFPPIAA